MKLLTSLMVGAFFMFSAVSTHAQDFYKGSVAAHSGDYVTALKQWLPLAEQGNASAQYSIGWMYGSGNGVAQDYAEALKWYRLAAPCVRVVVRCSIFQVGGIGQ
jgi:uncharacterized protein